METNPYELDKLQIASIRLSDTIYNFFSGTAHPVTIIDNARAVCEILSDIAKNFQKLGLIDEVSLMFDQGGGGGGLRLSRGGICRDFWLGHQAATMDWTCARYKCRWSLGALFFALYAVLF